MNEGKISETQNERDGRPMLPRGLPEFVNNKEELLMMIVCGLSG